jgi:hypothetical protein|tara:strand:+ start:2168 stop:2617 length:450 start_codon:yes stop_codon:yes gene_type:complete
MVEQRTQREFKTREKTTRKKTWAPPTQLPDPKPERGFSFRWVRVSLLGQEDARNVSIRFREGWEPVKSEEHPELVAAYGLTSNVNKSGNIESGGLMLCKIPTEVVDSRTDYYQTQNRQQLESVDNNFMRENNPRMPLFSDKRSTVSKGN